jgi:putative DNA primase/helicase
MELRGFLEATLPKTGEYFVAHISGDKLRQRKVSTLAQLESEIQIRNNARTDVYFGTGSFSNSRKQEDCISKKCLYVDIDCKASGQYDTKADAIRALKTALRVGLPSPSIIVDSGNGWHLYWTLEAEVTPEDWLATSKALITACKASQLKIDLSVTPDSARILRAPTSKNWKDPETPKPCDIRSSTGITYNLASLHETLKGLAPAPPSLRALPGGISVDPDDLSGDMSLKDIDRPLPKAKSMIDRCPLFASNIENEGRGTEEPVWFQLLHTLAFTSDGEDYIHEISRGHEKYSEDVTNNKWAYAKRKASGTGPTMCATFEAKGCSQCATCPFRERESTPVALAAQVPDGELPRGYRNSKYGLEGFNEDASDWLPIFPKTVKNMELFSKEDGQTGVEVPFLRMRIGGSLVEFPTTALTDDRSLKIILLQNTLGVEAAQLPLLRRFMSTFMDVLRDKQAARTAVTSYGWLGDKTQFHFNGKVYSDGGLVKSRVTSIPKSVEEVYTPTGDVAVWTECANHILSQPRHASWVAIASAFAAPLVTFTPVPSIAISIMSKGSGTGKTTALKVAQAVWANPTKALSHLDDTGNSVMAKMGMLNSLPIYWDEIRGVESMKAFATNTLFRFIESSGKARLNSNIEQRATATWGTAMVVASNESLLEVINHNDKTSDAGQARVFEVTAQPIKDDVKSNSEAGLFYRRTEANYGGVGELYAAHIGSNAKSVADEVAKTIGALEKSLKSKPDERFWISTVASLIVGAKRANQLGVCKFDLRAFANYLCGEFKVLREQKSVEHDPEIRAAMDIQKFVQESTGTTVVASTLPKRGVRDAGILLAPPNDREYVRVRIATNDRAVRVHEGALREWYTKYRGGAFSNFRATLLKMGCVCQARVSLDAGVFGHASRVACIDIPDSPLFEGLCDWDSLTNMRP